jgi:hypothetical protein
MSTTYDMALFFVTVISGEDLGNIYTEYELMFAPDRYEDIYVTVGIKEFCVGMVMEDGRFFSFERVGYPAKTVFTLNILAKTDVPYADIYRFYEGTVLPRLLPELQVSEFKTFPLEYDRQLNRLKMRAEFTVESYLTHSDSPWTP